jgi:predicted RNA-binding protein with PUA-like domain
MKHWLMKTEPDAFGIDHLEAKGTAPWDGVRNYQARNFMREMAVGDKVLFYHSSADPSGVAGLAVVARTAYPDHTSWDPASDHFDPASTPDNPRWSMVDVRFIERFPRLVPLEELRGIPELSDMILLQRSRLSVQPVEQRHYELIVRLAKRPAPAAAAAAKPAKKPAKTARPATSAKRTLKPRRKS